MHHRLAHGKELLRFFLENGHVIAEDEFGQAIVCRREDLDKLVVPINIPYAQPLPHGILRYILAQGGFTEKEFWEWVGT